MLIFSVGATVRRKGERGGPTVWRKGERGGTTLWKKSERGRGAEVWSAVTLAVQSNLQCSVTCSAASLAVQCQLL